MDEQDCRIVDFAARSVFRVVNESDREDEMALEEILHDLFSKVTSGWRLELIEADRIVVARLGDTAEYLFLNGFAAALGIINLARLYGRFDCRRALMLLNAVLDDYDGVSYQLICGEKVDQIPWHDLSMISLLVACGRISAQDVDLWDSLAKVGRDDVWEIFCGNMAAKNTGRSFVPTDVN